MKNVMQQVDNSLMIPVPNFSRRSIDSQVLTTSAFGRLTPIYLQEAVPNGTYNLSAESLVRLQPLASPLMHKCDYKVMYFFVPHRILWKNWEFFIQRKPDPVTGLKPAHPYYTSDLLQNLGQGVNGVGGNRLADYFGLKYPSGIQSALSSVKLNPFPFAAYQAIYNRYFRHKAVEPEFDFQLQEGSQDATRFSTILSALRTITFEDDYFNSALPTPQQGAPALIDDKAPVKVNKASNSVTLNFGGQNLTNFEGLSTFDTTNNNFGNYSHVKRGLANDPDGEVTTTGQLYADVNITVEEIRRASAMQRFLETSNHVGNYIDYLKAFYDVDLPDYRVQEPEYIGGTSNPIVISDVMNTADNNQGRIIGSGSGYSKSDGFSYKSLEHGLIMGLAVVTYKPIYKHAKPKFHFKTEEFDYFNPLFDVLGEQAVLDGELNQITSDAKSTFGYVPKHYEYRSSFDYVTGEFGSSYQHYHLARNYAPLTGLTYDFYKVPDERRIFQNQNAAFDPILLQIYNNVSALLPMSDLPSSQIV